jgi:putative glycosyl hydrolase-like family 6 (GHL6) protein
MSFDVSRRKFLEVAAAGGLLSSIPVAHVGSVAAAGQRESVAWFRRTYRWMQTNIAELDVTRYDIRWWREQWKRTHTQGIVVNAGGIVAYYPTEVPLHRRAQFLGERDLFGELRRAAAEDGIVVFARMDSNGAGDEMYKAHPDWFTRNAAGHPYPRDNALNMPCVNGPYYREHIPAILREIATKYKPEGFTDNSWSGLSRANICFCDNCRDKFRKASGFDLPARADWNERVYRAWIEWSYASRLEIWDLFNNTAREAGGPECLWVGMIGGSIAGAASEFRDYRAICRRTEMIMLDNQRRADTTGFQANGQTGKLVHGLVGWDKLAPESFALYQTYGATFRLSMRPEPEVRLWALEGFAAGIQPWWHYINAYHEDRRMYDTPVAMADWYAKHESYLVQREPIASVAIVYSQRNHDFFGRDDSELMVSQPQRGFMQALTRSRIPFVLLHADDLDRAPAGVRVLILPNLATMTESQVAAVRAFATHGNGIVASGATSLCDEWGEPRSDFALADLFGVSLPPAHPVRAVASRRQAATNNEQTYLRLSPELRAGTAGPHTASEPPARGTRHPVLKGFEQTDILAYGGSLAFMPVGPNAQVLMTYVPPRPAFPPEAVWLREDHTDVAGLVVTERADGMRVAYLAADLDRRYARDNISDTGTLLANVVRWAANDDMPLTVEGPGLLDCHLYRQSGRMILHIINLTNEGTWRGPIDELISVGPVRIGVRLVGGVRANRARLLVSDKAMNVSAKNGWMYVEVPSILDHEVLVFE